MLDAHTAGGPGAARPGEETRQEQGTDPEVSPRPPFPLHLWQGAGRMWVLSGSMHQQRLGPAFREGQVAAPWGAGLAAPCVQLGRCAVPVFRRPMAAACP